MCTHAPHPHPHHQARFSESGTQRGPREKALLALPQLGLSREPGHSGALGAVAWVCA